MAKIMVSTSGKGGVGKTRRRLRLARRWRKPDRMLPSSISTSACAISISSWARNVASSMT